MTPTLVGRWQTRIATLATLGLLVTLVLSLLLGTGVFLVLIYVALFGLAWDVLWIGLQKFRWDRDWPIAFQWLTAAIEGAFVFLVVALFGLTGIPQGGLGLGAFLIHYTLVFLVIFLWVQGPMRALFPFWRFHGGRIVPVVSSGQRR